MKNKFLAVFLLVLYLASCSIYKQDLEISRCDDGEIVNRQYSKASKLQLTLQELVKQGVPGVAMAVYSDEGWWSYATGFSKLEDQVPMQTCHLQYLQSISKTYMAVAVLKLYEQAKIELDVPFTRYLPEKYSRYITDAGKITVRMLLNHTSGIPEYNSAPAYVSYLLQHPQHEFVPEDYLTYIEGKPLDFEPGSKYSYRNTNYVILALLTDAVTGDHATFFRKTIFQPLGLTQSFYRGDRGYLTYTTIPNSYWDRYSDGILENASQLQRNNVAALVGDDGIVATPVEAIKFLKGLMEGQLLADTTMALMQTWVPDAQGMPTYGLGLDRAMLAGYEAYGHSGGGIGAGCQLYYFPAKNIYFFTGINLGTVTDSPIHEKVRKAVDKIHEVLLNK